MRKTFTQTRKIWTLMNRTFNFLNRLLFNGRILIIGRSTQKGKPVGRNTEIASWKNWKLWSPIEAKAKATNKDQYKDSYCHQLIREAWKKVSPKEVHKKVKSRAVLKVSVKLAVRVKLLLVAWETDKEIGKSSSKLGWSIKPLLNL